MSSPETPPQDPTSPVGSEATATPSELSASSPQVATNGKAEPSSEEGSSPPTAEQDLKPPSESPQEGAEPASSESASSESATSEPASSSGDKKKRRRRRRKKKPGSPESEGTAPEVVRLGGNHLPFEEAPAETAAEPSQTNRVERKKPKKHSGPPRERPPVNAGDIVFGKIQEITDEAIFVDIPGKARAIFDRQEMLLPDDEEPDKRHARPQAEAAAPSSPSPEQALAAATLDEAPPGPAESPAEGAVAQAAEPAAPPPTVAAAEPPKEPKVPRVILEVGADFIGVVHNDGARGGLVVLTHHPNRADKTKVAIEKHFEDKTTTKGLVTGVIKGGVEVDVDGVRAFAPGSHMDLHMGADLSYLVGKRLPFFVAQYAKRGRDVVLSRKSIIEEEAKKARAEALANLKVGQELDGVVRSVVPFGAFVDIGGIEGLVPLQEMSHNRAEGPSDVFKAGESTRVKVIKIDDRGKVWLSRKATVPDPWQEVARKYAQGTRHTGKVVRLQPFGAFIELEPGIDGLIHTQDLSIKRIESPSDVVKAGDSIDVVVAHVDPAQHKIALHPAPQGDMANEPAQKVLPHKPLKARIVAVESGGLLVRILGVTGRNARGYITSAGTGTPRGTELRKAFNIGQDVEAKVVEVDPRRGEVKLSIKALSEEQERSAYQQYRQQLKAEARFTLADMVTKKSSPR